MLARIRQATKNAIHHSKFVTVVDSEIDKFVETLNIDEVKKAFAPRGFPLKFTFEEEINFLAILALLNFGSGYRIPLHKHCNRGAFDTMMYGVMGLHLTDCLAAQRMVQMSIRDVAGTFDLPIEEEYEAMRGIKQLRPTALRALAELIRGALHQVGSILINLQCADFADFILEKPPSLRGETKEWTAEALVEKLARYFPAFDDRFIANTPTGPLEVPLMKKAQSLAVSLYTTFKDRDPRFNFPDMNNITILADNVLPAMLRHAAIINIKDSEMASKIDREVPINDRGFEGELRAAAVLGRGRTV